MNLTGGVNISKSLITAWIFACRREVLEKLKYPYFDYPLIEMEGEDGKIFRDMCSKMLLSVRISRMLVMM